LNLFLPPPGSQRNIVLRRLNKSDPLHDGSRYLHPVWQSFPRYRLNLRQQPFQPLRQILFVRFRPAWRNRDRQPDLRRPKQAFIFNLRVHLRSLFALGNDAYDIRFWDTMQPPHILFRDMDRKTQLARQQSRKLFLSLLRETRLESGFTQVQLAEALNVPQSFISKYESGERRLDLLEVRLICQALSIPLVKFVQRLEDILSSHRS